jgi:hypothetical protein
VLYDDGDKDVALARQHIRVVGGGVSTTATAGSTTPKSAVLSSVGDSESVLRAGDKVECLFGGRGTKWFKGEITARNSDGTYRVLYDDGDKDVALARQHIRVLGGGGGGGSGGASTSATAGSTTPKSAVLSSVGDSESVLRAGDKVECLFGGKGTRWFKGEITARNSDGTYRVLYDDGDKDVALARQHIRVVVGSAGGGGGGASTTATAGSTTPKSAVLSSVGDSSGESVLRAGDKVEGLFGGKGTRWFKGEITARNSDGTYRVLYDDGDKDVALARQHIRVVGGGGGGGGTSASPDEPSSRSYSRIPAGAVIEAQYRGAGPWLKGRVVRDHGDGTFALRFNDGDTWDPAPRLHIRVIDETPGASASSLLKDVGSSGTRVMPLQHCWDTAVIARGLTRRIYCIVCCLMGLMQTPHVTSLLPICCLCHAYGARLWSVIKHRFGNSAGPRGKRQ